ncbi:MAG: ATP-binding protein [Clostridia bacterium]|nr:ATP-binding protein [Clostridia bacterium]
MKSIIKVKDVQIKNLKNVRLGKIKANLSFDSMENANVIGLYGQNGSGKTAVVEAFQILKSLLKCSKLPDTSKYLLAHGEKEMELYFDFLISNKYGEFYVKYETTLINGDERLRVKNEKISYRENEPKKKFKELISKNDESTCIRNNHVNKLNEDVRVSVKVANKMAEENATSFVFSKTLTEMYHEFFDDTAIELMKNLIIDFNKDFHVIDNLQNGLIVANIMMPFSIHIENKRGQIPYKLTETMLLEPSVFETLEKVIDQINVVLKTIIPKLQIVINKIHEEKMENGESGVRFEFLSKKGSVELPLRCESAGILKIISVLSTLIAVYNNANACVVIDELDAGVYEYLLGELLEVISENGKGQLYFTSHNLRILEVLPIKELWFTTLNEENRFMKLKGVKKLSNARDIYLRAIQLGGQNEEIYGETSMFDIKRSFRRAGAVNV